MRMPMIYVVAMVAVLVSVPSMVWAQENKSVEPASYLDSNTIGFLHADLQEFDFGKAFELLTENEGVLAIWNAAPAREELLAARPFIVGTVELLKKKGATDVYVFLNLTDLSGLSVVIPAVDEKQAKKFKSVFPPGELVGNNLVFGTTVNLLDIGLPKRRDAEALLELADGHQATLVIAPSDDHARVIGEVMPDLPKPLDDVSGSMVSEGLFLTVVAIDSLEPFEGKVQIVSKTEGASKLVAEKTGELLQAMTKGEFGLAPAKQELLGEAMKTFNPKQAGKVIELRFNESDFEKLKPAMGGLIEQ